MTAEPRIFQISTSDGGVPKLGVHSVAVTVHGLEGDRQNDLVHHGGPNRAVCLYSLERIVALQAEGHPIYPGSTGENLTLTGLDWAQVVPGVRLRLGDHVIVEITQYTTPCAKLAGSFDKGDVRRMSQEEHPGWARVYARILSEGSIQIGDRVRLGVEGG